MALALDRRYVSAAAKLPVKFLSNMKVLIPNFAKSKSISIRRLTTSLIYYDESSNS